MNPVRRPWHSVRMERVRGQFVALGLGMIADSGRLGSLDVMELNPALDVRNKTGLLAVDLIESLFGKSTLMRVERR